MGSAQDKASGKKDRLKGKIKEGAGKLTDDEAMEAEGRKDQTKGSAREALGKAKDTVDKAKESAKDALRRD